MQPKIPYRETIRAKGESKYRHKNKPEEQDSLPKSGCVLDPGPRDSGIDFQESWSGRTWTGFVPSVDKGVQAASQEGVLAGYRVVDVKIDFYDGKQHPVDSKDVAFQIAGKQAFKQGILECDPCLLEPIYDLKD